MLFKVPTSTSLLTPTIIVMGSYFALVKWLPPSFKGESNLIIGVTCGWNLKVEHYKNILESFIDLLGRVIIFFVGMPPIRRATLKGKESLLQMIFEMSIVKTTLL